MSQKGSSIVSSDNPELKYKKALMEIQKIHNANKVLKAQSEEMKVQYERQVSQMAISLQHLEKENQEIKNDKVELQKFLSELQISNSQLRKQYNNLQRQITYLNDVLTEQNTELKKVHAFKDEKGLTALINSYEDREINYRKDIGRQQQLIKSLKTSCETLENDLSEQRRQRFKLEDINNSLRMQISKYRELNNSLLSKNQSIVASFLTRTSEGRQKYREAESILSELGRQLELVKHTRIQQQNIQRATVSLDSYESILQQKNKLEGQIHRLRQKIQESQNKSKQIFILEEKMKKATLKAEQLQGQCNMLKSKLVVVETKDMMQQSDDVELKQFQERVILNIGQNDPLPAIKNSSDSSHFQLMKAYVVELKQKLSKALTDRKEYQKKYRSLKEKIGEKAQKAISLEEQNKLLRGKLEGFQRLSERLQFELQRNIQDHEQEMNKMKQMTSSLLSKKSDETKVANAFIRAQLDLELDKFQRVQKGLRQQIDAVKQQLSTEKIKYSTLIDNHKQSSQFLNIYKNKFEEVTKQIQELRQIFSLSQENGLKFQQLYRQQRAKNEALINQKQVLTTKIAQVNEQSQKRISVQSQYQQKQAKYQSEIRKLRIQVSQAKAQILQLQGNLRQAIRQADEKTRLYASQAGKNQSSYFNTIQQNYQKQKQRNKLLESQLATFKLRLQRAQSQSQKVVTLQDNLIKKTDQLNDLRRKTIGFQKQVGVLETELREIKGQYENLKRENSTLKSKLLQNAQDIRKTYESKQVENKRIQQKINEQLAAATSQLRQQKRGGARLQVELQNIKSQLRRYEQLLQQQKRKNISISQQLSQLRNLYQNNCNENERLKSQIKYKTNIQQGLNNQITSTQQRIFKLNQENTQVRLKLQSTENDYSELRRQLGGLKIYLNQIQDYSNVRSPNGGWQQQREKENLANFVQRLRKVIRSSQLSLSQPTVIDYHRGSFSNFNNTTPLPDYLKPYVEQSFNNKDHKYEPASQQSSPFILNYGNYGENYNENFATEGYNM